VLFSIFTRLAIARQLIANQPSENLNVDPAKPTITNKWYLVLHRKYQSLDIITATTITINPIVLLVKLSLLYLFTAIFPSTIPKRIER
jgi:hypothetical protein